MPSEGFLCRTYPPPAPPLGCRSPLPDQAVRVLSRRTSGLRRTWGLTWRAVWGEQEWPGGGHADGSQDGLTWRLPGEGREQAEPLGLQVQDPPREVCPAPTPALPTALDSPGFCLADEPSAWLRATLPPPGCFPEWPLSRGIQSRREGLWLARLVHKMVGTWGS